MGDGENVKIDMGCNRIICRHKCWLQKSSWTLESGVECLGGTSRGVVPKMSTFCKTGFEKPIL